MKEQVVLKEENSGTLRRPDGAKYSNANSLDQNDIASRSRFTKDTHEKNDEALD